MKKNQPSLGGGNSNFPIFEVHFSGRDSQKWLKFQGIPEMHAYKEFWDVGAFFCCVESCKHFPEQVPTSLITKQPFLRGWDRFHLIFGSVFREEPSLKVGKSLNTSLWGVSIASGVFFVMQRVINTFLNKFQLRLSLNDHFWVGWDRFHSVWLRFQGGALPESREIRERSHSRS